MSASSPDLERQVSNTTQVGEDYAPGDLNPTEEVTVRSNIDQASPADGPSHHASSRRNRPSNPLPPFAPSEVEVKEEMDEKPWRCGDTRHYDIPKNGDDIPKNDDGWQKFNAIVEKYDNGMCGAWKDEVDNLLIFAGLFSAVVSAFTTQSYQWLGEQSADSSARLLSFIATQFANSTNPLPPSLAIPEFTVTQAQIRINVVWFLSLTISLTTVLVGILCLQWLREFQHNTTLPHKEAVALRQMRYEGLTKWHVPNILSILPPLLQLSFVLFFIGLLDLLWSLNTFVAAWVSAAVGMVMLFLIATTALPGLQHALTRDKHLRVPQCPYKSPQSWLFYRAGHWSFCYALYLYAVLTKPPRQWNNIRWMPSHMRFLNSLCDDSWLAYDRRWRSLRDAEDLSERGIPTTIRDSDDIAHGLHWINETFAHSVEVISPVYHSLAEVDIPAATTTMSEAYAIRNLMDGHTVRVVGDDMLSDLKNDQSSLNEVQKRDIIAAFYLRLHQDRYPDLKTMYVETVIRILNTHYVPKSLYDWFSEILQDLASKRLLAPSVTTGAACQLNTNKIIIQTLMCVKLIITRNMLLPEDVAMAWTLLRQLLTLPPTPPPNHRHSTRPTAPNLNHIKPAGGLFEALERWLSQGEETDKWKRVKVCMEGMMRLFSSSINIAELNGVCPAQMAKAKGLVIALNEHLSRLGDAATVLGAATVLKRRRSRDTAYGVGEWESLVSRFQGIEI